ncbi:MAG: thiamine pyrophosphate-binding protein [Longimicrobiales bacterium]|nr:thiamine pyrophosphate-binding protein [Longimicrobiales bacterium]
MSNTRSARTAAVLQVLEDSGVTHVVGIPDNTSAPLFDALLHHPTIRLVEVTREGEAFALASGLWLGGANPLVVVQNTGLMESGDALRGTAVRMGAPLAFLVTARGYAKMEAAGLGPESPRTPELLTRPDVDSVALMTEPTLRAWGIPYRTCRSDDDPAKAVERLLTDARSGHHPTALLLAAELS